MNLKKQSASEFTEKKKLRNKNSVLSVLCFGNTDRG